MSMNVITRKSASRKGSNAATDSKGGKFVNAMRKLAQKRSTSRSKNPLQVGNVLTKKAPIKGGASFGSKIVKPEGHAGSVKVNADQRAMNPEQQPFKKKTSR